MSTEPLTGFMHRRNADGTHDAICLKCYALAAIRLTPSELLEAEERHICGKTGCDVLGLSPLVSCSAFTLELEKKIRPAFRWQEILQR
jgi:hypothetical protein